MSHNQESEKNKATKVVVELEALGHKPITFEMVGPSFAELAKEARRRVNKEDVFLFEKDGESELSDIEGRSSILLVAHPCKRIGVSVNFEHQTKTETFSPSATVFRVLSWAIGKHGFGLDDTARAKANLILPGTDAPLPRDETIGKYVPEGSCALTLELTLRDFTNGND